MKKNLGFTLIELLVVISIISLLSSIVLSSVQDARNKARYAKFDQEFLQLRTAIELYRAGNNGDYPGSIYPTNSVDSVINELYSLDLFPLETIDLPDNYTLFQVYGTNSNTASGEGVFTCGSPTSSNNYSLYFGIYDLDVSKLPKLFVNGDNVDDGNYYYCIEV